MNWDDTWNTEGSPADDAIVTRCAACRNRTGANGALQWDGSVLCLRCAEAVARAARREKTPLTL